MKIQFTIDNNRFYLYGDVYLGEDEFKLIGEYLHDTPVENKVRKIRVTHHFIHKDTLMTICKENNNYSIAGKGYVTYETKRNKDYDAHFELEFAEDLDEKDYTEISKLGVKIQEEQ